MKSRCSCGKHNSRAGEVWSHVRGTKLRVIDNHVPGDRYDEERVYCEILEFTNDLSSDEIAQGFVVYKSGDRDGWILIDGMYGWNSIRSK